MKIQALNEWVFIEPIEEAGGLVALRALQKDKPWRAQVVSCGNGMVATCLELKAGDTVILRKYGYEEMEIGGERFYAIRAEEIMGKLL